MGSNWDKEAKRAIEQGDLEELKKLINPSNVNGLISNQSALEICINKGDLSDIKTREIFQFLVEQKADPNWQDRYGTSIITTICQNPSVTLDILTLLLDHKADPSIKDEDDWLPLDFLCQNPGATVPMVKLMFEKSGVDANHTTSDFFTSGNNLLHISVRQAKIEVIEYLLDIGVDARAVDSGNTSTINVLDL